MRIFFHSTWILSGSAAVAAATWLDSLFFRVLALVVGLIFVGIVRGIIVLLEKNELL